MTGVAGYLCQMLMASKRGSCLLLLSFIIYHLSFSPARAQDWAQTAFEGTVVDDRNGQPLPFATVYANERASTITNMLGQFTIKTDSATMLRISYVGYKPRQIRASQAQGRVGLQPMEMGLQEVTVVPIANLIQKATKETLRQLQKHKKKTANFFYRQTAYSDSLCFEFVESFLSGHPAAWLRDLELVTGRYAGITPDSLHHYSFYTNFYTFSQIEMAMKQRDLSGLGAIPPLSSRYHQYYDVDYEVIRDGEERLFAIHFIPKPEVKDAIYEATLYIDEATLLVRKMEGVGRNIRLLHRDYVRSRNWFRRVIIPTEFSFIVNMTDERGFLEVQSVYVSELHMLDDKLCETHSLLFNIGDRKMGKGEKMQFYGDLHTGIEHQGYDPQFWRNNEIVLRTPMERRVIELFEQNKLFGLFR